MESDTLTQLMADVAKLEADLVEAKKYANSWCRRNNREVPFPDESLVVSHTASVGRDRFYGQPMATAIRSLLQSRKAAGNGPGTVSEIYDGLAAGGFEFNTDDIENAKRMLRISLTKQTTIFHKLPDGKSYGLLDWYPAIKIKKSKPASEGDGGEAASDAGGSED